MSTVLNKFLIRQLMQNWLVVTLLLWLVLVAARLSLYLGQAAAGRLPADVVLALLAFKSVGFLVFLMPLTFFLALLWMFGRMNRDWESLALTASGVGPADILRILAMPVLLAMLLTAALSWFLVPETARQGYRLRAAAEQQIDVRNLTPGRFHVLSKTGLLFYAERDGEQAGTLENIFLHQQQGDQLRVVLAAVARMQVPSGSADGYLLLQNGYRYDGAAGRADFRRLQFREYAIRLAGPSAEPVKKQDAMRFRELWTDPNPQAQAEFQRRLARPVSVLVLSLIALPLGRFRPGVGHYYPLAMGVLLFTLYFNLLAAAQLWIAQGRLPASVGLWWVHLVPLTLVFGWNAVLRAAQKRRLFA
jgi:lipopolysaccharide export system permease protein